jgi:hypothetical protein
MRETFEVPEDDRFMLVTEHDESGFVYGKSYLGIERSDDLVIIQLTVSNTRTVAQKKALFARIVEKLEAKSRHPAGRMCSSIWSKSRRRTGRSGMAKRSTPEPFATHFPAKAWPRPDRRRAPVRRRKCDQRNMDMQPQRS